MNIECITEVIDCAKHIKRVKPATKPGVPDGQVRPRSKKLNQSQHSHFLNRTSWFVIYYYTSGSMLPSYQQVAEPCSEKQHIQYTRNLVGLEKRQNGTSRNLVAGARLCINETNIAKLHSNDLQVAPVGGQAQELNQGPLAVARHGRADTAA